MVKIDVHLRKLSQNENRGSLFWNTMYCQCQIIKTSVNARLHCPLPSSFYRTRENIRTNLIQPETRVPAVPKICAADGIYVSIFISSHAIIFSKVARSEPPKPARKQTRKQNTKWRFKVIHIITLASSLKFPKNSQQKRWKLPFSTTPLSFDARSPGKSCEYPHKPNIARK